MAYSGEYNDEKANSPFATRLRTLAEERGASQAKIAEYVGCTYQAIGAYMRGETVPKLTDAQKIAEYFGVSIDYLAGNQEEEKMENKNPIQQIVEGQKAALETLHELLQGKPILFAIGALSVLKGQAETIDEHIRESYSGSFDLEMTIADVMYRKSVVTEIATGKVEEVE